MSAGPARGAAALNLLLGFFPVALLLGWRHAPPAWVFAAAALAIIPLAGLMGRATEHLAGALGEGWGGLLNATFGNAAELIIALLALRRGLTEVVKASIAGSILGNLLLVLGLAALAGGLKRPLLKFNRTAASMGATLLLLAVIGLAVPATFHVLAQGDPSAHERELSTEIAVVLAVSYGLSLLFSLRTHAHLYTGEAPADEAEALGTRAWGRGRALLILLAATAGVAVMSELLVGAIQPAAAAFGLSDTFTGVIVVAVIGNAAEHSTAVLMAMRNKTDLAIHVAIGSSLQIALFVAPLLVFAGRAMGMPMDLRFTPFEVLAVVLAVLVVNHIVSDGETHWLEGAMLLAVYAILALAFHRLPAP